MRFITAVWRAVTTTFYWFWMLVVFLIIGIVIWGMVTTPEGHKLALTIIVFPFVWVYEMVLGLASLAATLAYTAVIVAAIGFVAWFLYNVFIRRTPATPDQTNAAKSDEQRFLK